MKDFNIMDVIGVICVIGVCVLIVILCTCSYIEGYTAGVQKTRAELAARGFGQYATNPQTGEVEWEWFDMVKKPNIENNNDIISKD